MAPSASLPTVTVVVPVLNEERYIGACLERVCRQTYPKVIEVLVIDGGSSDRTTNILMRYPSVRLLDNPQRIQAAALNVALEEAQGDVIVRVDGHCVIADDYVGSCVEALLETGAAMVGGAMTPHGDGWLAAGIAAAMRSRLGAGPATFHTGGQSRWTDTVYLGAYRTDLARSIGGYSPVPVNEDAEFAIRMRPHGGIWFDERIQSVYAPRGSLTRLASQFFRYGKGRAATVRRHPASLRPRQLAAPALLIALLFPGRRYVSVAYVGMVASRAALEAKSGPGSAVGMALAMPTMHATWGAGFIVGLLAGSSCAPRSADDKPTQDGAR